MAGTPWLRFPSCCILVCMPFPSNGLSSRQISSGNMCVARVCGVTGRVLEVTASVFEEWEKVEVRVRLFLESFPKEFVVHRCVFEVVARAEGSSLHSIPQY